MNVLIITDKFIMGGLESQIIGYVNHLSSSGHKAYLIAGLADRDYVYKSKFEGAEYLKEINEELDSINFVKIIRDIRHYISLWDIDVIHTHPFMSHIIGGFAAKLEKKQHVLSLHGPASIPNYFGPVYSFLLKYIILPSSDKILCVSEETKNLLPLTLFKKEQLLICRNAVNIRIFKPSDNAKKKSLYGQWVFISRLDADKSSGLIDFAIKAKSIGITGLTVIGDGPYKNDLLIKLQELSLSEFVEFKPACLDIQSCIHEYTGVAGMGRVILEACACGKPTFLVGYDGVKGAVNVPLLLHARRRNYSGRGLVNISAEKMHSELNSSFHEGNLIYNRCYVSKNANEDCVWRSVINELTKNNISEDALLVGLFDFLEISSENFQIFADNNILLRLSEVLYTKYENLSSQQRQLLPLITSVLIDNNKFLNEEYKKQLTQAREYIEDKEIYIAKLKEELQKLTSAKNMDDVFINNS
ncbi:glycosyltransferase [Aeromonas dhakensis]|uniref:glycosyltransferase n=1 Tax=Aeromonas dhakensis TaxID=196024 RepID=UPI003276C9E0